MINVKMKAALLSVFFILAASPAYAYLDPGTGSMLLQGLIGGIAAGGAVVAMYFQKIKSFFKRDSSDSDIMKNTPKDDG